MNLIEAIKSGKPFKRNVDATAWLEVRHRKTEGYFYVISDEQEGYLCVEDIVADDWEIQEPTVTITKTQFWDAYASGLKAWESKYKVTDAGSWAVQDLETVITVMTSKLGLE